MLIPSRDRKGAMVAGAILFLLAVVPAPAADPIRVQREGSFYRVTISGTLPISPVTQISAEGDLTVRGKASAAAHYTITTRFRTPNEAQARLAAQAMNNIRLLGSAVAFEGPGSVSIELPRGTRTLALSSEDGSLDAADIDGSVLAETVAGRIALDRIGGNVEIHSSGGATSLGRIGGVVRCLSGGGSIRAIRINGEASFETNGGDIVLGQVVGVLRAVTSGGGIHIDDAGSQVYAGTSGGPIAILRALGLVMAQSSAGPIDIGSAPAVDCQSGSGTIRLNNVSGPMRASTDRGSVIADILRGRPLQDSFLSTGSGDILVLLPSDMGVEVEAEISGTRMRNAIVSDYPGLRFTTRESSVSARGRINGGGPKLRLRGVGGRIEIRRK